MVADDSLVWDMVAMARKLPDGNHVASSDISRMEGFNIQPCNLHFLRYRVDLLIVLTINRLRWMPNYSATKLAAFPVIS